MKTHFKISTGKGTPSLVSIIKGIVPIVKSIKVGDPSHFERDIIVESEPFDVFELGNQLRREVGRAYSLGIDPIFSYELVSIEATSEEWEKLEEIYATKKLKKKLGGKKN